MTNVHQYNLSLRWMHQHKYPDRSMIIALETSVFASEVIGGQIFFPFELSYSSFNDLCNVRPDIVMKWRDLALPSSSFCLAVFLIHKVDLDYLILGLCQWSFHSREYSNTENPPSSTKHISYLR